MTIELDMRTDLAKVTPENLGKQATCRYSAPCAIGAMMTPEQREELISKDEDQEAVSFLIRRGIVTVPLDQKIDFDSLQSAFDSGSKETFSLVLARLQKKYLTPA